MLDDDEGDADETVAESDDDSQFIGTDTSALDAAFGGDSESSSSSQSLSSGDNVEVQYRLRLPDGTEVYKQWGDGNGGSFNFELGGGHVIPGFDNAIAGMHVGQEMDDVEIPADQAYGSKGFPGMNIPPNSDLVYDLKVVRKN